VFLKRPQNLTLKAGSTAKLECQAEGEPKPEISWHKDGGGYFPAASERRMHVLPADVTFFIVDVKFGDSGTYSCSAENLAGKVTTDVVLTVVGMFGHLNQVGLLTSVYLCLEPPVFIKPMEHKDITEGETTVLECMAGGHPKPKLTWTKDSQPLEATSRHFFTAENQLLIIVNSAKTDSGNYNCEIANSVGTERGSSRLTIIPRKSQRNFYIFRNPFSAGIFRYVIYIFKKWPRRIRDRILSELNFLHLFTLTKFNRFRIQNMVKSWEFESNRKSRQI